MIFYGPGTYNAVITSASLGESKEKKTPCIDFVITIQSKHVPGRDPEAVEPKGRMIQKWITDKTIDYVAKDLESLGYAHQNFDHLDELAGKEVEVYCKHETYQGNDGAQKEREQWNFSFSDGAMFANPLAGTEVMKLNALFGKRLTGKTNGAAAGNTSTERINPAKEQQKQAAADAKVDAEAEQVF